MSFLFGKSKKNQNGLPAAAREISSSQGPDTQAAPASGKPGERTRNGSQSQNSTPGSSINNSLSSIQSVQNTSSPEPKTLRARAESELHDNRPNMGPMGPPARAPGESPYPWSQRRLNFTTAANPFPRYGAAVNASASKDGIIYLMGGLVNGTTVKGDLWVVDSGNWSMACYPISTTGDGPGPRVGHASLLVGNAFIVFGGDTKQGDEDMLDDTLYLLNTSSKHWSRAMPAGPRPAGRYGHTLNIVNSKIYIFGGQVEGKFFNDLVAFDLNALQSTNCKWEILIPNGPPDGTQSPTAIPPRRTNHSMITWNEKLYLFGGTDGVNWFNDVWVYDPKVNSWQELDCIGYIPVAREGHAAALVNDTMYIFGGRTREGTDLLDLAAFKISSRRWYMFQNMGPSPSARSGHSMTAFGKHIIVLAGEPSSSQSDRGELSLAYVLDTSKIRYPPTESGNQAQQSVASRKGSGDRGGRPGIRESTVAPQPAGRSEAAMGGQGVGSRLPRMANPQAPSGPPPQQQPPHPRASNVHHQAHAQGRKTPTKGERAMGPPLDTSRPVLHEGENVPPSLRDTHPATDMADSRPMREHSPGIQGQQGQQLNFAVPYQSPQEVRPARKTSRSDRQQRSVESVDSVPHGTPRPSMEAQRSGNEPEMKPVDSALGMSPVMSRQNSELVRELEAARGRNAWYASELSLARKAGYQPNASNSPILDERAADMFGEDDRPLIEALLKMRSELARLQDSLETQTVTSANKVAELEKQRDAAISEAAYAKAKLAAHGGSQAGTPQPDSARNTGSPDVDRYAEMSRKLAASLAMQTELASKAELLQQHLEAERQAKQLAEDTAEVAQRRVVELDSNRQLIASELETLRAELHESERRAREEAAKSTEAQASARLLAVDKARLESRLAKVLDESNSQSASLESVHQALVASSDKAALFERMYEEEKIQRNELEEKVSQLLTENDRQIKELERTNRHLREAQEMAQKHASEAEMHRKAVMAGLERLADRRTEEVDIPDERISILQQQVEAANTMARKNRDAADTASEKLRRAEERIAGLEAYQEQASREGLSIRKQLQAALKEAQDLRAEKAEFHQQIERHQLESNALEVQLKTLKNLLEERGISAMDVRRSRVLDSPGSRFGTPELNRVRELEQQLDSSIKAHEELRATFEQREHEVSKEWEEKLTALANDHQAAVKYLRGTERMLTKMKQELDRYKSANAKLEADLAAERERHDSDLSANWEEEREAFHKELADLESQLESLRAEVASANEARELAMRQLQELENALAQSRVDLDALRRENGMLHERARDAESRVQMFLDQFETSVDSYRQQSMNPQTPTTGTMNGHRRGHDSISGDSIYTNDDGEKTPDAAAMSAAAADRNSVALDSLASELDALRNHWETTNRTYRFSDRFDFERTPTTDAPVLSNSLAAWKSKMYLHDDAGSGVHSQSDATATKQQDATHSEPSGAATKEPTLAGGHEDNEH